MGSRVIDQVHVVHAGRTGRHAGKTRQTSIDMLDDLRGRRLFLLQHVLDQIDAPARTVRFVTKKQVCRACRSTKATMHTGTEDFF